jgi:hypothetical protein
MEESCRGNNKKIACPQKMSDGRLFTDYRPRCISNMLPDTNMNSYEYRQYLQANATKIMDATRREIYDANKCGPCMQPYNIGTMLPEKSIVTCDSSTCKSSVVNVNGLGTGRSYSKPSSTEQHFIAQKEEESSRMMKNFESCVLTHDDPLFYSYSKTVQSCERAMKPSGMLPLCKEDDEK